MTAPWMLQFGGHHLAINLTLLGSQATMAPSLPAAQPATYTFEGQTIRPLGHENDKGFALVNALDGKQRAEAILGYRVSDLVLGPGQDGRTIQPEGIRASALSASQQTMLWDLVREWVGIMNDAFADRGWRNSARTRTTRISRGADRRPTAARRISAFRDQRWSSSTPRRTASITFTPSIAIRPTITGRSLRAGRSTALALALTAAVAISTAASAHRRDEYLQAARLAVEPGRVELELDLTPGIAVSAATIADIDRDRDGVLSAG